MHRRFERRRVTIMFCELAGSVAFFEKFDPARFSRWIESFRSMSLDQVHRSGGSVGHFCGDSMLACFGHPLPHLDDLERSVRTALGIVNSVKTNIVNNDQQDNKHLSVRIGIESGEVIIGHTGKKYSYCSSEFFGKPVNAAVLFQSVADPNQIIVSERTKSALDGLFEFSQLDYQSIRGLACPIAIFEVQA